MSFCDWLFSFCPTFCPTRPGLAGYSVDINMKKKAMQNFSVQTFEELTKDLPAN